MTEKELCPPEMPMPGLMWVLRDDFNNAWRSLHALLSCADLPQEVRAAAKTAASCFSRAVRLASEGTGEETGSKVAEARCRVRAMEPLLREGVRAMDRAPVACTASSCSPGTTELAANARSAGYALAITAFGIVDDANDDIRKYDPWFDQAEKVFAAWRQLFGDGEVTDIELTEIAAGLAHGKEGRALGTELLRAVKKGRGVLLPRITRWLQARERVEVRGFILARRKEKGGPDLWRVEPAGTEGPREEC